MGVLVRVQELGDTLFLKEKEERNQILSASLGDCEAQSPGHFALSSVGAVRQRSWGVNEGASLCLRDAAEYEFMRQSLSVFQILSVTMEAKLVHLLLVQLERACSAHGS